MSKIASMKVQVSAETSRFDAAMGRIRQQMRGVQQSAAMTGAAGIGPIGGRVAGMVGLMGLSGPMMAVAAATAGLASVLTSESQRREQDKARGLENFNEILQSRLSVAEQASFKRVADMARPGGSAGDVAAMLGAFRSTEFSQMQKLVQAGVDPAQLSAIAAMSDADALKAL
ncbi:MAG: hypothetical protein VKK63_12360, partial [Synechococcus sp.]|nr:hypothetical protein [Synechococcus sp.]